MREKLFVDYFATGFVRRTQGGILCDIDFIEAETGQILWTRQLTLKDENDLDVLSSDLNRIAQSICRSIANIAVDNVRSRRIPEIADHNLNIAGATLMHRRTIKDFLRARDFLEEATNRMPTIPEPLAWLAKWHVLKVMKGYTQNASHDGQLALDLCAQALDIDPESSLCLTIAGFVHNNLFLNSDQARAHLDAALSINGSESLAWLMKGSLFAFTGQGEDAVVATTKARGFSPIDPFGYYYDSLAGTAYLAANDSENALRLANRSLAANDRHLSTHRVKITALHLLGRGAEAKSAARALLRCYPDFSLDSYRRSHPASDTGLGKNVVAALTAAGIK